MTETNLQQASQKIKGKTRAPKNTVKKNQDLERDQSPKGEVYDTYKLEERKEIIKQFKEKLALFNNQELNSESDATCDKVPNWSEDIKKVDIKIFNRWILQIIRQYRPKLNLKDTGILENFRRKIKGWFKTEGSPDNRGDRLIPQSEEDEMSSFKESLMKAIEAMKVRDFPYLQALMRPVISKIRSRNKKKDTKNMFSTKYWSTFINKPENQDIKKKWESLPTENKKDLGKGKDKKDDHKAISTPFSLEELNNNTEEEYAKFFEELKNNNEEEDDKFFEKLKHYNEEEDAEFLKKFTMAPVRNLVMEDDNKRELHEIPCYHDVFQNQNQIDHKMPNENQFGDINDEPQNENDEDQITESKVGDYWIKETGFPGIQETVFDIEPQLMANPYLLNQSFGEYDCIPRSPVSWNGQEENLEQYIAQEEEEEEVEEGKNENDFYFFKPVKYCGSENEKQLVDPKATQSHSTGISSSHKNVPGGVFDSVYQEVARGYASPMEAIQE